MPLQPIGTLDVAGDLILLDDSRLLMDLGTEGSSDLLAVDGSAELGGTVVIRLADDYEAALGDSFALLTASSLRGGFADVVLMGDSGGLGVDVRYRGTEVVAVMVPEPAVAGVVPFVFAGLLRRRGRVRG